MGRSDWKVGRAKGRRLEQTGFEPVLTTVRSFRFVASLRGHVAAVYRVSWSSDSRMLVSASKDSTLKVSPCSSLRTAGVRDPDNCFVDSLANLAVGFKDIQDSRRSARAR